MTSGLFLLIQVTDALAQAGLNCHLFGGWAEEARELRAPGPHSDIDLLFEAANFSSLERVLVRALPEAQPVAAKRFHHKRAFTFSGCLVELLLATPDAERPCQTLFWGDTPYRWSAPLARPLVFAGHGFSVATAENLTGYRAARPRLAPERWRDLASIVPA